MIRPLLLFIIILVSGLIRILGLTWWLRRPKKIDQPECIEMTTCEDETKPETCVQKKVCPYNSQFTFKNKVSWIHGYPSSYAPKTADENESIMLINDRTIQIFYASPEIKFGDYTYRFDVSDYSNNFYRTFDSNGSRSVPIVIDFKIEGTDDEYYADIDRVGEPGNKGAYVDLKVGKNTPNLKIGWFVEDKIFDKIRVTTPFLFDIPPISNPR